MITDKYGNKRWYNKKGELHRDNDLPAIEWPGGTKVWYLNNELHRDDKPAVEWSDGTKEWYQNDKLHRVDGPAVEKSNGTKVWYLNNKLHRIKGPAVEFPSGGKLWFIEGKRLKEEEFKKVIKRRNELARWVYQRWYSDFMRNPATERGQRYINKDYDRMMKELEVL